MCETGVLTATSHFLTPGMTHALHTPHARCSRETAQRRVREYVRKRHGSKRTLRRRGRRCGLDWMACTLHWHIALHSGYVPVMPHHVDSMCNSTKGSAWMVYRSALCSRGPDRWFSPMCKYRNSVLKCIRGVDKNLQHKVCGWSGLVWKWLITNWYFMFISGLFPPTISAYIGIMYISHLGG